MNGRVPTSSSVAAAKDSLARNSSCERRAVITKPFGRFTNPSRESMALHIDSRDGLVNLPNGFVITARLSQDEFRASESFAAATEEDVGTRPFIHYRFSCGE